MKLHHTIHCYSINFNWASGISTGMQKKSDQSFGGITWLSPVHDYGYKVLSDSSLSSV